MYRPNNTYRRRYGASKQELMVVVCVTFGCAKKLTLAEQLAGTKCTSCQQVKDTRFKHYKH
jgi:hypothetical protein